MGSGVAGYEGRFDVIGWYLVRRVGRFRRVLPRTRPILLDLGMGRGRDLLWFARSGLRVLGIDRDPEGIRKARQRAARLGVPIRTKRADFRTVELAERFDVVYSSCSLNYLAPELRRSRFSYFQHITVPGGIQAVNAFLSRPGGRARDRDPDEYAFRPGELRSYYREWEILESRRMSFPCTATGPPHRHTVDVVIARKPAPHDEGELRPGRTSHP